MILVILVATVVGAAAEVRRGAAAERMADRLLTFALYTLLPIVVFFNVVRLDLTSDLAGGLALSWVALLATGGAVFLIGCRLGWPRPAVGAVVVAVLSANTGYLGYPLTAIFFGTERLPEAVAYDVLVAVPMLVVVSFAVGAALGDEAGRGARDRIRSFAVRNPLLPAFVLALIAPDELAPGVLVDLSQALVFALLPVGFFAAGTYLAATSPVAFSVPRPQAEIAVAVAARLLVVPTILALLAVPLIDLPDPYLLLAAMPAGLNTLVVANAFGLDRRLAAGIIAWSTGIALAGALAAAPVAGLV